MHRCLIACLLLTAAALRAENWAPNITFAATWDSNATNADAASDQIDSIRLNGDALVSQHYALDPRNALHAALHVGGEWWPRYNGLTSGVLGGRLGWQYKFGADPLAPEFHIDGFADAVAAKDTGRRGYALGGIASLRKRLNTATRVSLSEEVGWYDARYSVYDRGWSETGIELERDLSTVTRFTIGGRFRDGDIVSYADSARADLAALAPHRSDTELFGRPMTAYRIDARTWSARAGIARALDESSAVIVAYEWRRTHRDTLRFTNSLLSISFVHQF